MRSMATGRRVAVLDFGTAFANFLTCWLGHSLSAAPAYSPGHIAELPPSEIEAVYAVLSLQSARRIADQTWDIVHDRPDDDPVKLRVVKCHEALARLSAGP